MKLILLLVVTGLKAQNKQYAQEVVNVLCSDSLAGRGYVNNGMGKAANFIKNEFVRNGLKPLPKLNSYFHSYTHGANTFPGIVELYVDNEKLEAGKDYIIDPGSLGGKGSVAPIYANKSNFRKLNQKKVNGKLLIMDSRGIQSKDSINLFFYSLWKLAKYATAVAEVESKLTWSASQKVQFPFVSFKIQATQVERIAKAKKISWTVENGFIKDFKANNVVGLVEGELKDSFVVVSAHYDHLGMMGRETYFRGASDNASGTSLMLDLASHYATLKPKYSMVFVAFGSEEIGLVGSKVFVDEEVIPLKNIKAVLNIDLMGGGSEGVTVVNGSVYPKLFALVELANKNAGLTKIKARGKSANSDHHWFSEKNVPSIFIYTNGDVVAYHDTEDNPSGLKWLHYEQLYTLMKSFINSL